MAIQPTLISTVRDVAIKIQNGDGTALKNLGVAPVAAGTRIKSLVISSDDTAAQVLQIYKTIAGVDYLLGEVSIPIGAGSDGATNSVDGLNASRIAGIQTDGVNRWIDVSNGTTINIKSKVAVTAGKTIYISAELGDFT